MTNKVCYVAVFEDLCSSSDFEVANDIWLKINSSDEKKVDVKYLEDYLGWLETKDKLEDDDEKEKGGICYKYRISTIKELIAYHAGIPTNREISDIEDAYNGMWEVRRLLISTSLKRNSLNGMRIELHKEANILTNKLQDFVSFLQMAKREKKEDK